MDVRRMAPSLLALADAFDLAHGQVGGGYALPPVLQVRGHAAGSFAVDLCLVEQEPTGDLIDLARAADEAQTSTPAAVVDAAFSAMRWTQLRGRKGPERAIEEVAPGRLRVHWPDGTRLDAPAAAEDLAASAEFNRLASLVFEPLGQDGVDSVDLGSRSGSGEELTVRREDLPAFNTVEPEDDLVSDNVRTVAVRLVNLAFKEGNKWKVSDGTSIFWASLHDLGFLQRVTSSEEVFARDDILRVRLRDQQYRSGDGGFRVEHHIERVLEHRRALPPEQLPLTLDQLPLTLD